MAKFFILSAMAAILVSCAHGKTEYFPTTVPSSNTAEVTIFRDNNLFGWGFTLKVALDGVVIANLRAGERVSFYVDQGFHSLGISKPTLMATFEKGRKYYFLIGADYSSFGFEIQQIGDRQVEYWLAETKPIK